MADLLIVDDNPHHLSFVGKCVERAGHRCSLLQDGRQCLAAVERRVPDLIITGILMAEFDGLELIRALKENWPAIPVIGMTGGSRGVIRPYVDYFHLFSARAVLAKPFTARDLFDAIDRALDGNPGKGAVPTMDSPAYRQKGGDMNVWTRRGEDHDSALRQIRC